MPQQDNIHSVKLIKREGKLVYLNDGQAALFREFVNSLEEEQEVNMFYEADKDDGTNNQLALIHVCIRKLALETGYTFDEMKNEIKRQAGLTTDGYKKSLADCSKEELALVIEIIRKAGEMVNISF
jgi:hypothetical protein